MKQLFTLIIAVVLAIPLFAHRAPVNEEFHVTLDKLPEGSIWMGIGEKSAVWNITNSNIAGEITNLTYNGKAYQAFKYNGTAAVKLNIRHSRSNSPIPDEKTTANGYIRTTDQVQYMVLVKRTGTSTIALVPTFTFRKTSFKTIDANGIVQTIRNWNNTADSTLTATATVTYKPTDGNTIVPTDGNTPYVFNAAKWSGNNQKPSVEYVQNDYYIFRGEVFTDGNIILDKFQPGDIVTVISWIHGQDVCELRPEDNGWHFPTLRIGQQAQRSVLNSSEFKSTTNRSYFDRNQLAVGEFWIQAEDYDEPWINNRVTHSATLSTNEQYSDGWGYGGRSREWDTLNGVEQSGNIRVDVGAGNGVSVGIGGATSWDGNGGYRARANTNGQDFLLPIFTQKNWDDKFKNNNTSARLNNMANDYGAYAEYTIRVEEEMYVDITLNAGLHLFNYNAYRNDPNIAPNVSTQDINGQTDKNYIKEFGGTYRLYVNDVLQQTAWDARPPRRINSINDLANLNKWEQVTEPVSVAPRGGATLRAASNPSLNVAHVLPAFDDDESGNTWNASNKQDIANKLYEKGLLSEREYNFLSTPDYANIHLTPGQHTLKVQSMGGRTTFDAIKVFTHTAADTPTALERIMLRGADGSDDIAPVEFYDLQGRRVENPSGGIFIRRQGSSVRKIVIR